MGTLLGLSHMLFSMASDGLRNTSKWGEGEMVKLLLDTIQDQRDRSEGVREKAGPGGDSTVQSRSSKGNAVAGEYRLGHLSLFSAQMVLSLPLSSA